MNWNIKMTKAEALAIQAAHIAHYSNICPNIGELVAARTTADQLDDDKQYDVITINRHIPRGFDIEQLAYGRGV